MFFGAFAGIMYPMRDALHPTGERGGPVARSARARTPPRFRRVATAAARARGPRRRHLPDRSTAPSHHPAPPPQPAAYCEQLLETMGPRFSGPIAIVRNWTFCLFYVMAELWGSVVVSVLFWGFANQITTVDEAERFYPLFGLGANVALIFSGQAVKYFSKVRARAARGWPPTTAAWLRCPAAAAAAACRSSAAPSSHPQPL
jgi:hypothetical protein